MGNLPRLLEPLLICRGFLILLCRTFATEAPKGATSSRNARAMLRRALAPTPRCCPPHAGRGPAPDCRAGLSRAVPVGVGAQARPRGPPARGCTPGSCGGLFPSPGRDKRGHLGPGVVRPRSRLGRRIGLRRLILRCVARVFPKTFCKWLRASRHPALLWRPRALPSVPLRHYAMPSACPKAPTGGLPQGANRTRSANARTTYTDRNPPAQDRRTPGRHPPKGGPGGVLWCPGRSRTDRPLIWSSTARWAEPPRPPVGEPLAVARWTARAPSPLPPAPIPSAGRPRQSTMSARRGLRIKHPWPRAAAGESGLIGGAGTAPTPWPKQVSVCMAAP